MVESVNYTSLSDIVRPTGGAERDKVAIVFEDQQITYAELDTRSNRLANLIVARGVRRGDRIGILSKNNPCFLDVLLATAKAGAVLVPLNWRLSPTELAWILGDNTPTLLFVEHGLDRLVPADVSIPIIGFEDRDRPCWDAELGDDLEPGVPVLLDDVAMLVYTSGTTGHPKGAMITHGNFVRHCGLDSPAVPYWTGIDRDEICLVVLPLFHVGGIELLLRPLFTGATVVLHREVDLGRILTDIGRLKVTMVGLVPTALQMMLDHAGSHTTDFTTLRKFLYGAAPIPLPLLKQGLARMTCDFVGTYGMTESNGVCAMLAPADHRASDAAHLTSVGQPTFDARIRIVDLEGNDVAVGETGEIIVKAAGVMKGYWNRPEATAETIDAEGWLRSGDAGYLDADGYLYICDRVKDMICSGGENVYPAEVESAVFGHPAVAEVAVIGIPDNHWGESVCAFVVARSGAVIDEADIIAWARDRIASYKAPRSVRIVDALPKNATGKILRREIRAAALAELATQE